MRRAKFLPRPILLESGWLKLELQIWIFKTIWQKHYFFKLMDKNMDKLKIYLV